MAQLSLLQPEVAESQKKAPLKIGYLWQYERADLDVIAATPLHIRAVCSALRQRGHAVQLLTFRAQQAQVTADEAFQAWQPAVQPITTGNTFRAVERPIRFAQSRLRLPYLRLFDSLRYAEAVYRSCGDCDALYERHWLHSYGGLLAARRLGVPLVLEINGDILQEYRQLNMKLSRTQWRALHFIIARTFRYADHLIAVSEPLRQTLLTKWSLNPKKVTVVPNGVAIERFQPMTPVQIAATRQRFQLNGSPIVVFVGTFKPWHGLDQLLEAFASLSPERNTQLLLIGDGPMREQLEEQAQKLQIEQRVSVTGLLPPDDVAALLTAADIAVLSPRATPAAQAQSPMKLFEYMAAGRAIIAPALPNIESVLRHGRNGYLVAADDAQALASAIQLLLDDQTLRKQLGQAARLQAVQQHSWDAAAAAIESILYRCQASRD